MKVLVIGGAGYIGSHVCKALTLAGHEVTVFDNLSSGLRQNLLPSVKFFHGDILNIQSLDTACSGGSYSGLIHLAALKAAGESMLLPEKYARHNVVGTLQVMEAALKWNIPNFVFSSSAAVYGEPQYLPIDEKHPTVPENFYGHSKLAIEGYLNWYSKLKNLRYAALRYFNAAGYDPDGELVGLEQNPANLLPIIMEVAAGLRPKMQVFGNDYNTPDGTGIRDYVHVSDLANAHVAALEFLEKRQQSLTVNLGSEMGASVLEIIQAAQRVSGKTVTHEIVGRRPGDPAKLVASSALALELLAWKPLFSDVNSLVETTWKAYQKNLVN